MEALLSETISSRDIDRLKNVANTEVVRRLLIKYFFAKGFAESFDKHMYPSMIQDLPAVIPLLSNKIEIVPHAVDVDPATGKAVLGWNLFVLGTHRMYLGETHHYDLANLAKQIQTQGMVIPEGSKGTSRRETTPRRIVTFITRVLGQSEAGFIDLNQPMDQSMVQGQLYGAKAALMGMPQQFFARSHGM